MSNSFLNAVFERSQSRGVARLVLLSIADRADDQGRAYCGASDLCKRTNATRREIFYSLAWLRENHEIQVEDEKGPKGCNRYLISFGQCNPCISANISLVQKTTPTSARIAPKPLRTPIDIKKGEIDFASFWESYPRKVSKTSAIKAWAKAKLPPLSELLTALEKQKANWTDPQFIPHPATWINGRRWEDEVTTAATSPKQAAPAPRLDIVHHKAPPRIIT